MRLKPFSQLFNPETNQILDPEGLSREMFPGIEPQPGGDEQRPRPRPAAGGRRTFVREGNAMNDGHVMAGPFNMAQAMIGQQGSHLAGMANQVQSALQDEHDSRVAQERELRRQEHEKELMRMRLESQRKSDEAALIRSLLSGM